jgi:hypothetical protein
MSYCFEIRACDYVCMCVKLDLIPSKGASHLYDKWTLQQHSIERLNSVGPVQLEKHATCAFHLLHMSNACVMMARPEEGGRSTVWGSTIHLVANLCLRFLFDKALQT